MKVPLVLFVLALSSAVFAQTPPIEPGVSLELAKWRAVQYSNISYKLNLTLEKMSPVLKGTIEIRVNLSEPGAVATGFPVPIILDWRKIKGHEEKSTISNVSINGRVLSPGFSRPNKVLSPGFSRPDAETRPPEGGTQNMYREHNEHLIFSDGVVMGENVIKLDFTSPILTSGSAITRYVDKEDGSEYIYSLFVPSDASTAFPVFDQPDLKARFTLEVDDRPKEWTVIANTTGEEAIAQYWTGSGQEKSYITTFDKTKPISTYVFAFAAGPWEKVSAPKSEPGAVATGFFPLVGSRNPVAIAPGSDKTELHTSIYVRKSQAARFKPHAAETFRLTREAVKYFEQYFDYKFPFPKYDLVLIPEFPFGGMEHAGATFLRESSIIFPQEPTKNDYISRATLIFHETAHQWFGDTVTMRWFDDLWLKEGFATFMAYKAMEKIMPEMNAWKVFYERVKQTAYQTDSTRGTTAIYQPIANLSAAKSAYGNIVYNKAPAFLRQAEFYLGDDKFQTAVRAFLKKHEFGNAGWEDLVKEFESASKQDLKSWANEWVSTPGLAIIRTQSLGGENGCFAYELKQTAVNGSSRSWKMRTKTLPKFDSGFQYPMDQIIDAESRGAGCDFDKNPPIFLFPNYGDYGYGIFLLDEKSRDYVLKNIQNEKDPFLRAMMWGALWDSVREGEMDPRVFVELVVKVLSPGFSRPGSERRPPEGGTQNGDDESTVALLLNRVGTAMNYYMSEPRAVATGLLDGNDVKRPIATAPGSDLRHRVEDMLIDRMRNAPTLGQRITYYRAFLNIASSDKARGVLKETLKKSEPPALAGGQKRGDGSTNWPAANAPGSDLPLKTKDKFDIVTRLLILGDPDASKLLAELEKTETSDDAKRYAYAAKAGIGSAENKAKYWSDFINNKQISESWIEAAMRPWNSIWHSELTLPYLQKALQELPNHKRSRKIFFVNGWLGAFIGGQRSEEALAIVNKFLADNPNLDNDLRLKVLENVDLIERAVRIRAKYSQNRLR